MPKEVVENWLKERHFEDVFKTQRENVHGGIFWPIHSSFLTFKDHIQWYHDTVEICEKHGLHVIAAGLHSCPWDLSLLLGYFGSPTDEMREKDSKARYELVQRAVDMGGAADAIHGAGLKSAYFFEQQLTPAGAELMKKLKDVLDPNHILNQGKRWKAVEKLAL
ncbi:MAG: FAD-linked oxidase C-terminal domain-containing protein, partial [Nitrososphaerales archaeon]